MNNGLLPAVLFLLVLQPAGAQLSQAAPPAGQPPAVTETQAVTDVPVLERFRSYTGQRTIEELSALFNQPASTIVRQQPAIAISDGRTAVLITARIAPEDGHAINFSLDGATLVSLKKIKTDEWQIKALPNQGTVAMSLLVLHGTVSTTYPLIAAPPLPPAADAGLQGFQEYLDKSGDAEAATMDLNGDGHIDYQDDYIYTANYLAKQQASGRDRSARKQRALQRTLMLKPEPQKPEYDLNDFPD